MPYHRLFYHLVWSTKHRQRLLTPQREEKIYGFMRVKAMGLGATVFAIGGVEDHVHMVVSIPPKIAVAKFVGQVKGVASAKFNSQNPADERFAWQAEYGAFTFDRKSLPNVVAYANNQKRHHAEHNVIPVLERMEDDDARSLMHESAAAYETVDDTWWQEMMSLE